MYCHNDLKNISLKLRATPHKLHMYIIVFQTPNLDDAKTVCYIFDSYLKNMIASQRAYFQIKILFFRLCHSVDIFQSFFDNY